MSEIYQESVDRAVRLLDEGRLEEADALCRALIESPSHDGRARHVAGLVAMKRGEPRLAAETLQQAARERPQDPAVQNSLGEALRAAGDGDKAEGHLRYALHLDRTLAAAHVNLGLLLWQRGDIANAALCFRNALVIEPDLGDALRALGRLRLEEGERDEAIRDLQKAVTLDPGDFASRMALGDAYSETGDVPAALECYRVAAQTSRDEGAAWFRAACTSFELCRVGEALDLLNESFHTSRPPATVREPRALAGRLTSVLSLAADNALVRVARSQWHKVGAAPVVRHAPGEAAALEPLHPFTNDLFVANLAPGLVLPGELLPMTPDGDLFLDHVVSRPMHRPYTSRFVMHMSDEGRLLMAVPSKSRVFAEAVLLGAAPAYIEWLLECLARLWVVRQRPSLEALPLVVQADLTIWQKDLLRLVGYDDTRLVEMGPDELLECRTLHVPSLVSMGHFVAPGAVEHLRRELRRALPESPQDAPRRIYLSRQDMETRRLSNAGDIESMLSRRGFTIVQAASLSALEQLVLMQGAEVVVGIEGAALAHVFHAPARAKVGVIVAEGLQSNRYCGPSAVLGQEISFLLADADFQSHPDHAECDLWLDPALLERYLASL